MQESSALFPEQEQLRCPRCDSSNTKFCYYNNYNLAQPRHFCKSCRRYWTKGGALRNIPVGGATRKNTAKRNPKTYHPPSEPAAAPSSAEMFRDWLSPHGGSGNSTNGSELGRSGESSLGSDPVRVRGLELQNAAASQGFMGFQMAANGGGSNGGGGGSGWPDLVIYTPGSSSTY